MFTCNDVQYESCPDTDRFFGSPSKNMNYRLKDVVEVGDTMRYEYDFGSTTELVIKIHSCRDGEKCLKNDNADDEEYYEPEIILPICNSPRMGVYGYEGSRVYPDQFEPDKE